MPRYQWKCYVCEASNAPGLEACASCGFPAVATGKDIDLARRMAAGATRSSLAERDRYRTFWPRFFAGWIDFFVLLPLAWLDDLAWSAVSAPVLLVPWFVASSLAGVGYSILLHGFYGQTVGKRLMRVKVLDLSGGKLSMKQAVLRDIVPLALVVYMLFIDLPTVLSGKNPDMLDHSDFSWLVVSYGMTAWFFLEVVTMLFNDKRRALHDFIAGSVVVRTEALPS